MQIFFIDSEDFSADEINDINCARIFSAADLERLRNISVEMLKQRFLLSRFLIKKTLSGALNCPAEKIVLRQNAGGRPEVEQPQTQISFNLSHSHNLIAIAIDEKYSIGLDVEYQRPRDFLKIAEYFFSKDENDFLRNLSPENLMQNFYDFWTAKEAFVKCRGEQIFHNSQKLELVNDGKQYFLPKNVAEYKLYQPHIKNGYSAAVFVKSGFITDKQIFSAPKNFANSNLTKKIPLHKITSLTI